MRRNIPIRKIHRLFKWYLVVSHEAPSLSRLLCSAAFLDIFGFRASRAYNSDRTKAGPLWCGGKATGIKRLPTASYRYHSTGKDSVTDLISLDKENSIVSVTARAARRSGDYKSITMNAMTWPRSFQHSIYCPSFSSRPGLLSDWGPCLKAVKSFKSRTSLKVKSDAFSKHFKLPIIFHRNTTLS